jgi:nucleotide-binding universal stress UspA family protein
MSPGPESIRAVPRPRRVAPIVVGLDDSEASLAALRWAADEAAAHQAPLIAVHVLDPRCRGFAPYALPGSKEADEQGQSAMSDDTTAVKKMIAASGVNPALDVFEVGVPSQVLVRCAIGARMLVLGHADHHRDRDGETFRRGPVLGSIARACVARATCPVVVIPIPERRAASQGAEPEPKRVEVAQSAPLIGRRTIYPKRQPVPIAHGSAAPARKDVNR